MTSWACKFLQKGLPTSFLCFLLFFTWTGGSFGGELDELCSASAMGDMARVRAIIKVNPQLVRAKNDDGFTPLHFAVMGDQIEIVRFLLSMKAEVNARSNEEWTPLHCAARKAHVEVAKVLLDSGAFVNAQDNKGETPLTIAKKNGHRKMIMLLEERRGREKNRP